METLSLSRLDSLLIICSSIILLSHLWILIVDFKTQDSAGAIGWASDRIALWLGLAYTLGTLVWITYCTSRKTYFPRWDSGNSRYLPMHDQSNIYYRVRKSTLSSMALDMCCGYSHSRAGLAVGFGKGITSNLDVFTSRSITDYLVNLVNSRVDGCVSILRYPYAFGLQRGSDFHTFTPRTSALVWTESERRESGEFGAAA